MVDFSGRPHARLMRQGFAAHAEGYNRFSGWQIGRHHGTPAGRAFAQGWLAREYRAWPLTAEHARWIGEEDAAEGSESGGFCSPFEENDPRHAAYAAGFEAESAAVRAAYAA